MFNTTTTNHILPQVIESYNVSDWEIETDTGFVSIDEIHKTVTYDQWYVECENGKWYIGADLHRVFDENMNTIYTYELKVNETKIQTDEGPSLVVKVENRGDPQHMYDFTLADDSNHRFYANGILSHNSTNMGIRTVLMTHLLPGLRVATIVPRHEQLRTIAYKYSEISNAYRFKSTNSKGKDNLYNKEVYHPNGQISTMDIWYILTNPDKIRGKTYDWIDYDEYQDFDDSLEGVIAATQSRSTLRSVTYSGTSKTTDSSLEARWLESSRGLWRLTCSACKHDNYPTVDHGVFDMIQPEGLCCKKCGRKLNVREGRWDFEAPTMLELGRWGFHIPQIIVPANTENRDIWIDIYRNSRTMDKKTFMEEFLGEATEEGSRELTAKDLQNICILGPIQDVQKKALDPKTNPYMFTVGGCDWGGSDYNPAEKSKESYTVHVILGVKRLGGIDILSVKHYAGMVYDDIIGEIAADHHKFKCSAIAGDFGGSQFYIPTLKKLVDPLKVVAFKYGGNAMLSIPPSSQHFGNLYNLNRTESLTSLIMDIKAMKIRSPSWEQMSKSLLECLNLVRTPIELASGANDLLYKKRGNKPDDFFHALNYANTIAKLLQGIPLFEDPTKQAMFNNYMRYGTFTPPVIHRRSHVHAIMG